jgi:hypothetical protein
MPQHSSDMLASDICKMKKIINNKFDEIPEFTPIGPKNRKSYSDDPNVWFHEIRRHVQRLEASDSNQVIPASPDRVLRQRTLMGLTE